MTTSMMDQKTQFLTRPAISLRSKPRPEDRQTIINILSATGFFHDFEVQVAVELLDDRLAKGESSDYHFLFVDCDSETVGFCCFGSISVAPSRFDLYWIAVHPVKSQKGIGTQLLQAAEDVMRSMGAKIVYIETSSKPKYDPTCFFYRKNAYLEVARIPRYYADNDDRVVFMKALE